MNRKKQISAACALVHDHFTYLADIINYGEDERWDDHSDTVLAGNDFEDDCDGFACTVGAILHKRGIPKEDIYLMLVDTRGGQSMNHAVCGVMDSGQMWICENNHYFPFKQGWNFYGYIKYRTMADQQWYKND